MVFFCYFWLILVIIGAQVGIEATFHVSVGEELAVEGVPHVTFVGVFFRIQSPEINFRAVIKQIDNELI